MRRINVALCAVLVCVLVACTSTVVPKVVKPAVVSYDQGEKNGGVIGFDPAGFLLITPHARDRYNGLVALYGREFVPPVSPDDGLTRTNTLWRMDPEHVEKFARMNRWLKNGRFPK